MRKSLSVLFLFCLLFSAFGQKRKKSGVQVSKVQTSEINWWGYKMVKSEATTHTGFVKLKNGKFIFTDKVLTGGEFTLDMRSLAATDITGEEQQKLTHHLKSIDFFDVKKYPTSKFIITKVLPSTNPEYNYLIYGNLTLKGTRKTISFPAKIRTNDRFVEFESAKISLNRRDYKVYYQSSIRDYFINNQIDIQIKMTAN
ncbi:YceI family protein [Bergeyella zoohelcum]|uniref:Uncharacterized conserved protein n=1 Tax=Bergeyella zoohelcum TaxID=1015 RepID=A0A7Z8YPM1_9FLAO|nr:YceI family protein [Bergeyella zoohelcum]VDH04148.1 Uncharacterized conserved protein [Bergeyella zoohelcum]